MTEFNDGNQYHFITDPDAYASQRTMYEMRVWSGSTGSMLEDTKWREQRRLMQPRLDGILWYQKPFNGMSPEEQANLLCDSLVKLEPNEMVMLDTEKNANQPTSNLGDYADFMRRWCAVVEPRLNTWAWIYVPLNLSQQLNRGVTGNRIVKAPHYSATPNWPHDVHQYTDNGYFPGANGNGDCNRTALTVREMLDRCRRAAPEDGIWNEIRGQFAGVR